MPNEPLDLDDDEPPRRPRRSRRRDHFSQSPPEAWRVLKWTVLGAGGVLFAIAFDSPAIHAAVYAALACFCGIAARVAQAEEHLRVLRNWHDEATNSED